MIRPLICVWLPFNGKDSDLISIDGVILLDSPVQVPSVWMQNSSVSCGIHRAFSLLLLLITFAISLEPDQEPAQERILSVLVLIQNIPHLDSVPEIWFEKNNF